MTVDWNEVVQTVTPSIVKIETPEGHGTGFLCLYNDDRTICGIATACHVVEHADRWQQPIRILHYPSSGTVLLKENDRTIIMNENLDSAVILTPVGQLAVRGSGILKS